MAAFAKDVRGEIAMAAPGATERQRVEALQAAFACADAVGLDEARGAGSDCTTTPSGRWLFQTS